jgi:hypothetical protein
VLIVKTDFRKARAKLAAMRPAVQRTLPECLESEGRVVAVSLAKSTQPYGTGEAARKAGRDRTAADIFKVYTTFGKAFANFPDQRVAKAFWSAVKRGDFEKAHWILKKNGTALRNVPIGRFDGGVLHITSRNSRTGRVSSKMIPRLIVTNPDRLSAYIKKKQDEVGFGKSAWAAIARELGGTRGLRAPKLSGGERDITANWITRKSGPHHIDRQYGNANRPVLTLTSKVRYADNILDNSAKREAVAIAYNRLVKQVQMAAAYEARMATRQLAA